MDGHEQAVHVEDGQRVDQHVALLPAPVRLQHARVAEHVAVREHGALAAPGGAAGVDDDRKVVGLAARRRVRVGVVRGALQQGAAAVLAQREHVARAGLEGDLADPAEVGRAAHHHGGLGVAHEVLDLAGLVGRVQRQVHVAAAQHGQVQDEVLDRLLHLHGDA